MFYSLFYKIKRLFLYLGYCLFILLISFNDLASKDIEPTQIDVLPKMSVLDTCLPENSSWPQLRKITYGSLLSSVVAIGVIAMLPSDISNWNVNPSDLQLSKVPKRWWDNVSKLPVWDKDDHFINYIMHPYFGAVYYMGARDSGFGPWGAFLYSTAMSTLWEYGMEAVAEKPSIQDLVFTPTGGWFIAEYAFLPIYNYIDNHDGKLLNSAVLGSVVKFLVNPILNLSSMFGFNVKSHLSLHLDCSRELNKDTHLASFRPLKSKCVELSMDVVF